MDKSLIYIECLLPVPLHTFTYHLPVELAEKAIPGCRVIVPFGARRFYSALIVSVSNNHPGHETKAVESFLDGEPVLDVKCLELWKWLASYYCCSLGEVMKAALPGGLKLESQTTVYPLSGQTLPDSLPELEEIILQYLKDNKPPTIQQLNKLTRKSNIYPAIQSLIAKKLVGVDEDIVEKFKSKSETHYRISQSITDEKRVELALETLKKAKKQFELFLFLIDELDFFNQRNSLTISKKEVVKSLKFTESAIKGLIEKGFIEPLEIETSRIDYHAPISRFNLNLSEFQQKALIEIKHQFERKNVTLLHGVTASGKTELYIKLIQETLAHGKQVLYLLPEIALTSQMIERLQAVFGATAGVYHSRFNDSERVEIWNKVLRFGNDGSGYQLILGARSSLFLPFSNLGLIIVDEEHETSFKQFDPAPRYNARDAAVVLAQLHGAKVLMGTATPSFESYHNVHTGKYGYVSLSQRFHNVELPRIILSDLSDAHKRKQMVSFLTPLLYNEIKNALLNKEQIILFKNRRGFSHYIQCKNCGWIPMCTHCDVSLTYHKYSHNLQCHYCGFSSKMPQHCEKCHSTDILDKGLGTEKIEDELNILFPEAVIDRLDLDSTRKKFGHEKIINRFSEGKTNILIGTQMITKGLDFENVSIVGIVDADSQMNFPDFRSYERAFQLISQVSGRAGRKNKQGKVIIQTHQPDHPLFKYIETNNFDKMYNDTITERRIFQYPPWYRLIYITVKHKNIDRAKLAANILADELKKEVKATILGPEFPAISRIQQYYQLMIRLKFDKNGPLAQQKQNIIEIAKKIKQMEHNSSVIFTIDVDPI
jgi:primosomal protein N' (replication factor Y) (superfamily II helicase)